MAWQAFNLADQLQTPVIILNDKFLANSTQSMLPLKEDGLTIDRGRIATQKELEEAVAGGKRLIVEVGAGGLQNLDERKT